MLSVVVALLQTVRLSWRSRAVLHAEILAVAVENIVRIASIEVTNVLR
jgi:hypothetical protein